jgi:hypothetical protein
LLRLSDYGCRLRLWVSVRLFFRRLKRHSSIVDIGVMTRIFTESRALPEQADSIVNLRSFEADTQPGAGDLQRTNGHVENMSNLVSIFSLLDKIFYLLKPFWRKLH